jgi:hypothetical protein
VMTWKRGDTEDIWRDIFKCQDLLLLLFRRSASYFYSLRSSNSSIYGYVFRRYLQILGLIWTELSVIFFIKLQEFACNYYSLIYMCMLPIYSIKK